MSGDLISRKAVTDALTSLHTHNGMELSASVDYVEACEAICDIPAVDAEPVRHGEWVYNESDYVPYCDQCLMPQDATCNYCPGCGAKMDLKEG